MVLEILEDQVLCSRQTEFKKLSLTFHIRFSSHIIKLLKMEIQGNVWISSIHGDQLI